MHVDDLLQLSSLDLKLLWGDGPVLTRTINGVTATDLEDPTRFLREGDLVLSGLVWWSPDQGQARIDRFVTALASAGTAALFAGEEAHGAVPEALVDACRSHGIALAAVPRRTDFRAVIDAVHLRQWGALSRRPSGGHALPEEVRAELGRLLEADADTGTLLDRALAPLGTPACHLLTGTGRTLARTASAPPLSPAQAVDLLSRPTGVRLRVEPEGGTGAAAYAAWQLYLHEADAAPPRLLHEIAEVLARHRERRVAEEAGERQRAGELLALLDVPRTPALPAVQAALRACGLPEQGPYQVLMADAGAPPGHSVAALGEAVRQLPGRPRFAVGALADGTAGAVLALGAGVGAGRGRGEREGAGDGVSDLPELDAVWTVLSACAPRTPVHGGLGPQAQGADALGASLARARHALAAARTGSPAHGRLTRADGTTSLTALLAGVSDSVRDAFRTRTLGPLLDETDASQRMLLHTLETYLAHNCSWARTAEALHLHVNTVHYRIRRVEVLTGRDLSRLDHKLDLYAALHSP